MYKFEMNGAAIVGWVVASVYGVVSMIKEIITAF